MNWPDNYLIPGIEPYMIYGFRILTNTFLCKRVLGRHCRSKKRRIIKKWAKNPKNYVSIPDDSVYRLPGNVLVMHPAIKDKIMGAI
jgi:hypothetical protein